MSDSPGAKTIPEMKPGWISRVFGIETARLQACDARWNGTDWERGDSFRFLFHSRRGKFLLLTGMREWKVLTQDQALEVFRQVPEKLLSEAEAFAEIAIDPLPLERDEDQDDRIYRIVRNDKWEFSIWLDHKEPPDGWYHIGVAGKKNTCLEYINQNLVFGAPNPGIP